jgi:tellurite resistance protein TerC
MSHQILLWGGFVLFVVAMLVLDLKFFQRKAHEIGIREALLVTAFWIALALAFNAGVYFWGGRKAAFEFLTGFLLEKSLSVDNLFVFLLIFKYFHVPRVYQHGVLFWGILGAIVMRFIFILAGVALIHHFHGIIYLFGAILVVSGVKLWRGKDQEIHPEKNPVLRLFRRLMPVTAEYEDGRFIVKREGRMWATPLLVVLLMVETTDVIFAIDSVPAVLAITLDPFIVYTSNIFAILGLRSLFFALSGIMRLFHHLHYGLSAILVFVGVKMIITDLYKVPIGAALGVIGGVLLLSIIASLIWPEKKADSGVSGSSAVI